RLAVGRPGVQIPGVEIDVAYRVNAVKGVAAPVTPVNGFVSHVGFLEALDLSNGTLVKLFLDFVWPPHGHLGPDGLRQLQGRGQVEVLSRLGPEPNQMNVERGRHPAYRLGFDPGWGGSGRGN